MTLSRTVLVAALLLLFVLPGRTRAESAPSQPYFRITVVDQDTSRGIPCVKLEMMNCAQYWTDSAGVVAFYEPDLMNQQVWFTVESHGYRNENAPMGIHGVVLETKPGGSAIVPMRRINIAQRIYRMTGSGIYRDSILLGDKVPAVEEEGKIPIMGQDGGDVVVFKDKFYWLWGDTAIPRFPLGVFRSVCAVSDLPGKGGLDPDRGVALRYMRKKDGEFRPIINLPSQPGCPYWYSKPRVVRDGRGNEHFVTDYAQVDSSMKTVETGLVEYSEKTGFFELVGKYPNNPTVHMGGSGSTVFRYKTGGREYFYVPSPYPTVRYPTDYASQLDVSAREAFTCLKQGSRFDGSPKQLDRDKDGNLRWGWKKDTSPVAEKEMDQLVKARAMKPEEQWYAVRDVDTGIRVLSQHGSIYWNAYRQRWVCIRVQNWGETLVGEIWYLEGDTPQGPWVYARKIITHAWKDHACSFYVPAQIPYFDRDNGRTIYIKGSFSSDYGDTKTAAPRHNYNIMMYKLELDDPRLYLPVPVYHDRGKDGIYGTKEAFAGKERDLEIAWFAPDRPASGTLGVYEVRDPKGKVVRLTMEPQGTAKPVFYALAAGSAVSTTPAVSQTVCVYEFTNGKSGKRVYSTRESVEAEGFVRSPAPLCRVWSNPILFNPFGKAGAAIW